MIVLFTRAVFSKLRMRKDDAALALWDRGEIGAVSGIQWMWWLLLWGLVRPTELLAGQPIPGYHYPAKSSRSKDVVALRIELLDTVSK